MRRDRPPETLPTRGSRRAGRLPGLLYLKDETIPMQRPWLANYPPGVPPEIPVDSYPSLAALIEESFQRWASRDAAVCMNRTLGFRQIDELSQALGAWLQHCGLKPGDRVALMMPNVPQYLVALAAVLRCGMTVVNVNPLYTARELEHQLKDSGARAIVVLENFAHTLEEVIGRTPVEHVVLASLGDLIGFWKGRFINFAVRHLKKMVPEYRLPLGPGRTVVRFNDAVQHGGTLHLTRPNVGPDDVAFLQYTGGTTGVSKGATLLHRNVVANVLQTEAWFTPVLARVGDKPLNVVCALPLYHIFALTICALMGMRLGACNLLIPNPRDLPALVRALSGRKIHMFPAVNTLFNALAHDADFARLDFSELVVSNGGGMAVQQATAQRWLAVTGCPVVEGYGLSETSPVATSNRLDIRDFTGTIGLPIPNTDIVIRDDDGPCQHRSHQRFQPAHRRAKSNRQRQTLACRRDRRTYADNIPSRVSRRPQARLDFSRPDRQPSWQAGAWRVCRQRT